MPSPFDIHSVRRRLVADGYRLDIDPSEFGFRAEISLDEEALGYSRFASRLQRLRQVAADLTDGRYALQAIRDPQTRERTGYAVSSDSQDVCNLIAEQMGVRRR